VPQSPIPLCGAPLNSGFVRRHMRALGLAIPATLALGCATSPICNSDGPAHALELKTHFPSSAVVETELKIPVEVRNIGGSAVSVCFDSAPQLLLASRNKFSAGKVASDNRCSIRMSLAPGATRTFRVRVYFPDVFAPGTVRANFSVRVARLESYPFPREFSWANCEELETSPASPTF
jgi:hypothetical protein